VLDLVEIWRDAQYRRTEEISSDINNLKTVSVFSGVGLLVSLVLASYGWDLGSGFFLSSGRMDDEWDCCGGRVTRIL
jgi:hypothetical protein